MAKHKYKPYIDELRHTVTVAGLNYEIWWTYQGKDTRPKYLTVMNRYSLFFQTSIHAHFVALIVSLYKLYETRGDTYNVPQFLRALRRDAALPAAELGNLDRHLQELRPLWKKIGVLRNKVFGHSSKAHTSSQAFREAGVTPNDLRDLLERSKVLLNELTQTLERSSHAFNLGSREDTERLLTHLQGVNRRAP